MAAILQIHCTSCDFKTKAFSNRELFVTLDNGEEQICRHPGERRSAERYTGKTLEELRAENRLRGKWSYICLECGQVDFYYIEHPVLIHWDFHNMVVDSYENVVETQAPCTQCGQQRLLLPTVMSDRRGCLGYLLNRPSKVLSVPCPICKMGELRKEMVAKT